MFSTGSQLLAVAGVFAFAATAVSVWQIVQHLRNLHNLPVQSKIIGITWMIPIYSCDSFLSLWVPSIDNYVNMLRDCYEAYVLYLFLSLMLSYLGCQEDDYHLVTYLEKQPVKQRPFPMNLICPGDLPRGKAFLRYCKFGTLQYCVVRPSTTLAAIVMQMMGVYHEGELDWSYGYMYIMFIINVSVAYAFVALISFYSELKSKLNPFSPVGKFLCIKFIIFFAFWQGIIITGLVGFGVIKSIDGVPKNSTSNGLQEFLICVEMFIAAIAFTYNFSHRPFVLEAAQSAGLHDLFAADPEMQHGIQHNPLRPFGSRSLGSKSHSLTSSRTSVASDGIEINAGSGGYGGDAAAGSSVAGHRVQQVPLARGNSAKQSLLVGVSGRLLGREKTGYQLVNLLNTDACGDDASEHRSAAAAPPQHQAKSTGSKNAQQAGASRVPPPLPHVQLQQKSEMKLNSGSSGDRRGGGDRNIMETHFAMNTAIRDFNEAMPVVLPSGFTMEQGKVVLSDPAARLRQLFHDDDGNAYGDDDDVDSGSDDDEMKSVHDVLFYRK